jgi:hypothetical protein
VNKSDGAGQLGQDRQDRIGRQDRRYSTDRTGQQGWDNRDRTVRVWQLGQDH